MPPLEPTRFADRRDAGRHLAQLLLHLTDRSDVAVLALPRGGVPVALEVAKALRLPLDLFMVRKLGAPGHEELAMGAVASGGLRWLNREVINALAVPPEVIDATTARERAELERREVRYRRGRGPLELAGRTLVLVDDGIATGATMLAALSALRPMGPARLIVAAPVIADGTREALLAYADEVVCVAAPVEFFAVGVWYGEFEQVTDEEVIALLEEAERIAPRAAS